MAKTPGTFEERALLVRIADDGSEHIVDEACVGVFGKLRGAVTFHTDVCETARAMDALPKDWDSGAATA